MESKAADGTRASSSKSKEGLWWRWTHGKSGTTASSSHVGSPYDTSNHTNSSSNSKPAATASPSNGVRWQKRTTRTPKEDNFSSLAWSSSPDAGNSSSSPKFFSATASSAARSSRASAVPSKKKTATSLSSRGLRDGYSSKKAPLGASSASSFMFSSREDKRAASSEISWSMGKSKRPAAKKDRRSAKSSSSMSSARVVATRNTQFLPDVNEDTEMRAPDAGANMFAFSTPQSKPSRRASSSFSSSRNEKTDKFSVAETPAFDFDGSFSRPSKAAFPPSSPSAASTVSSTSSFSSQSFSTVDPLVHCARAVLQDCIRKRQMEQSNARKRSIEGCFDGDLLESKEFGWHYDAVSKHRDYGMMSPGSSSSSDDELSQLSSMDQSFWGLPIEVRYQLPLALGTANETSKECTICQLRYGIGDHIVTLPCQHFFHACCVDKWLWNHTSCPLCRTEVSLDQETEVSCTKHNFTECSPVDQERIRRQMRSSSQHAGFRPVVPVEIDQLELEVSRMAIDEDSEVEDEPSYLVCQPVPTIIRAKDLEAMDADDEPAMAYFLPNGIADDSPPKKSIQTMDTPPGNEASVSTASGSSNSRSDVDFSGLHARPRPTLDLSPFGSSGGPALSPRPTNYLLSDLGGEIHTPRASRDFGDAAGSAPRSSSPFGLAGPFGSGISDTKTIGGAGAIRSPTSMFNRGQKAAKTYAMQGDGGNSAVYGGSETQNLYQGRGMSSYLSSGVTESPFGSSSMRTWPSTATDTSQPRRILQRPPGLAGPPGLSEPSAMQTRIQQRSQFGPFLPSSSSPMSSGVGANRAFPSTDDQYGPSLLPSLSLSTGIFGDHADGRGKFEGRSDLRAKALEFSMDAINALTPGSPTRPRRSERGRKMASPMGHDSSESSRNSSDQPRGKRRNQMAVRAQFRTLIPADEYSRTRVKILDLLLALHQILTLSYDFEEESSQREREKCGPTRRQVYREKQVKEPVKELSLLEETTPSAASPNTTSDSTQGSQESSELDAKLLKGGDVTDEATAKGSSVNDDTVRDSAEDTKNSVSDENAERIPACERRETKSESPVERSESDAERALAAINQQRAALKKKSKKEAAETPTGSLPTSTAEAEHSVRLEPSQVPVVEKKQPQAGKEHRKEKSKKDKATRKRQLEERKTSGDPTEAQDKLLEALATKSTPLSVRISQGLQKRGLAAASAGQRALVGTRSGCLWVAGRLNVKGLLATTFSYVESVLAVVFSVVLLLALHAASWFIRVHRVAFRAILTHRHIGFCFAFLYGFPFLVQYVFPWAPPWAPVCLWYAFLVQLFCTNGPTAMVTTFRVILPLVFLVEGISHHSFLLDLNGAELLLASFIISAVKTSNLCSPIFFLSLATQCLLAVFLGSELLVQWLQLALALYSLHVMAVTDDEWIGMGDEEDELSCHPVSMHHSIADYNHHPAPSSAVSIQKTKRLDRRALAYVRGRKLR
ncbi:Zinc finger, RING/FYVE/PHD-type [Phytophthora cactorum]|nr:Zinc finger, RING/FYVE/PHD-type [Phytophthora cactorum]